MANAQQDMWAFPFIMEGKKEKSENFTWKITQPVNCETDNFVYMIECIKKM